MSSRLFHRRDKLGRDQRQDLIGTTDHLIDQRQKKHVEDAFISSQLVELGLLDPRHAIGKRGVQKEGGYTKKSKFYIFQLYLFCVTSVMIVRLDTGIEWEAVFQWNEELHVVNATIASQCHIRLSRSV